MTARLTRRSLTVTTLVGLGALGGSAAATPIGERTAPAWQAIDRDQARYQGVRLQPVARQTSRLGKTGRTFAAQIKGSNEPLFVRLPRQGVGPAMRRHNVMRVLASQLERAELVPAAGSLTLLEDIGEGHITLGDKVRDVTKGTQVMVVEDVGTEFTPYKDFMEAGETGAARHFDDETRVQIALLHLLTRQLDANSTNLLLRKSDGSIKLLDHDVSMGIKHTGQVIRGSVFFPGRPLGYAAAQNRWQDLPKKAQRLVKRIAGASLAELEAAYRIEPDEAKSLKDMAERVKSMGLTRAIQSFKAEYPNLHAVKDAP